MSSTHQLEIPVKGMTCASCVGRIERELSAMAGVSEVNVNLATGRARVTHDEQQTTAALVNAIEALGFEPQGQQAELAIKGMTCASCVGRVEKQIATFPGVINAEVNLATGKARIQHAGADFAALTAMLTDSGYPAKRIDDAPATQQADPSEQFAETVESLKKSLFVAFALAIPLFILEMGGHVFPSFHDWLHALIGQKTSWIIQAALAAGVFFGPGWPLIKAGVRGLIRWQPDMNALVALGTGSAFGYSLVATFIPGVLPEGTVNVYYEAVGVIIALILLGRYMENKAKSNTSEAIQGLLKLQVKTARTITCCGNAKDVPIEEVTVGKTLEIRPGERIPLDGVVTSGDSFVDESMINGEPVPVQKTEGSPLVGGTINQTGVLRMEVQKVGGDTLLSQIIRLVEQAQGSRLPIQNLVNQITAWFVPAVMGAAALTFLVWVIFGPSPALTLALVNAVAVLIIACPCAMGLATPTSIMVGTGRAAQLGVLFRQGTALQGLQDAKVVAVDKTGTLTEGRPVLTDFVVAAGVDETRALQLQASLEHQSSHPVSRAIVAAAEDKQLQLLPVSEFDSLTGLGVRGTVDGQQLHAGSSRLMKQLAVDISGFADAAGQLAKEGKTPMYLAIDGQLAAMLAVADPIKASTPAAIRALHELGLKVVMISGDNQHTAQAIADQLDIDEVVAEVMPAQKVETVQQLQARYGKLAFVGDGINDAPALASADIGIAIGTGTDIAIDAADVVLMSGQLTGVVNALQISRSTLRNIKQNLFWAFAYNAALIPVAAGILYPVNGTLLSPMFAAGAMAMSSVFVVSNALRLRKVKAVLA
ncbi:heavy metal translocating P-type ATPase [Thiopseudomonas denitrificans]|uniref:P-type Cu(2+) transporter n=1 Tax=Thiopseudomonas denitrificans TaxID=1501432 RepID=A0A4V6PWG4_9GAMM|nr:heavy metal translocating P-type ATPase [Thiopseudomonas denitrificans]TDQ38627.1 Cu+-exporting ATPase/Au+-exporting ATPase [Thiopseudomonas denitrificans]